MEASVVRREKGSVLWWVAVSYVLGTCEDVKVRVEVKVQVQVQVQVKGNGCVGRVEITPGSVNLSRACVNHQLSGSVTSVNLERGR